MDLQILNPVDDPDWDARLLRSGDESFFHTAAWAGVLEESYGFRPLYFTALEENRIVFLMPLMEIRSRLTGRRGVSLPFTDQCRPFAAGGESTPEAVRRVIEYGRRNTWCYVEWRDLGDAAEGQPAREEFHVHDIDLLKAEAGLFSGLSDNNRRNIKKAVREGVTVEVEQSMDALKGFYRLNEMTRKRHGLPPQPFRFFKNVFEEVLSRGLGHVVSAFHDKKLIAASVFFHFGTGGMYKYGASDMDHQHLRANNLVMWEALKWYRERGFKTMSLGRTEMDNPGLLQFKRTWGAKENLMKYYRYDIRKKAYLPPRSAGGGAMTRIFSRTPAGLLRLVGRLLYRHVA